MMCKMCKACGVVLSDHGHYVTKDGRAVCHDCYGKENIRALEAERDQARAERYELKRSYELTSSYLETANARVAELEAELDVVNGKWCADNQSQGRGPCGVCRTCLRENAAKFESANEEATVLRIKLTEYGAQLDAGVSRMLELGNRVAEVERKHGELLSRCDQYEHDANHAEAHARRWKALAKRLRKRNRVQGESIEYYHRGRDQARADAARLRERIGKLLFEKGCDCWNSRVDDCDKCLACSIAAALKEGGK